MRTNPCRSQYSQDFTHDKLSKEASLKQINVGFKEWIGFKGKGVPFGLTKGGTMEKDNPNVYEIHDQGVKFSANECSLQGNAPYANECNLYALDSILRMQVMQSYMIQKFKIF
ncbi:hypothetical protein Bca101_056282 [Brassica carinata]